MKAPRPIFLFTDFGWEGPYVGQLVAAILGVDSTGRVHHLMHDAPAMRPQPAAYLLAACSRYLPEGGVVVAVVDPGVGGERAALWVETARLTVVGPDNGLLSRLPEIRSVARIDWSPPTLSASFHGRDLFAPVAARLARGEPPAASPIAPSAMVGHGWPSDSAEIVYIDRYGNAMTGLRADGVAGDRLLALSGQRIGRARTFCAAAPGEPFWYENSQGLVEVAVNGGSAAVLLGIRLGDPVRFR